VATAPLIPTQIETIFQAVTCSMGLNLSFAAPVDGQFPAGPAPNPNFYGVRIGWQQQGQPFCQVNEDVIALRCYEVDDEYNRIRDNPYLNQPTFTEVWNYTRVWEGYWTIYGPNSFDNARLIRSSLFRQYIHDQFASAELYWIPSPAAPMRIPELQDGQWWERVDFKARFNEFVTEAYPSQSVISSEVVLYDNYGNEIADIQVEES
jgi:hypothetical protein